VTFGKDPLLTEEQEEQLKIELGKLWDEGVIGREIARRLRFGEEGTSYENLNANHVYFYAQHFGFKRRRKLYNMKHPPESVYSKYAVKWRPGMPQSVVEDLLKEGVLWGYPKDFMGKYRRIEEK
jgi:hypothetical protein